MPTKHRPARPLQRRIIDFIIVPVAAIQPLSSVPQIITVYSRHDASSISLSSWALYEVFNLLWLWYGLAEKQKAVVISAVMFFILEGLVLVGGFLYGGVW